LHSDNPPDRCYYCKNELFTKVKYIAGKESYEAVFDGSNADDLNDFRPGMKAKKELGVKRSRKRSSTGLVKLNMK